MSSSNKKKGKNPAAVDNWLDSIGLYRKNVAYDETCLFRAVSEQLFQCQIYHERVRKECIDYGRRHYYDFWHLLEDENEWYNHLDLLEKHMVVCGNIEIQLISHKYNRDVVVYDATHQSVLQVTRRGLDKTLMLCLMNEDHYDVVYEKEHIQNAGFCQSIVYGILYENVFDVPNVQNIVHGMLYEKDLEKEGDKNTEVVVPPPVNIAPFPFKVAKALDPTIYRNIEYDSWTEVRRELRLGDWYYGDDNLILGTRCILNQDDQTYECYIQEIIKNENKCVVYVTKLAEKRTVNYTDLSPENDAKPWPLPYRFTKNQVATPSQAVTLETKLKLPKKRKDKRRVKSNSESQTQAVSSQQLAQDIEAFIGQPLQMQNNSGQNYNQAQSPPEISSSQSQHNLLVTPDIPSPMPKFSWETPWSTAAAASCEKFVWSQPATSPGMKPMVASAPTTPNVIPYHDSQYPFVYNYPVDSSFNSWNSSSVYSPPSQFPLEPDEDNENVDNFQEYAGNFEAQPAKEIPPLILPPPNPPVEIYSAVIPIPPGTPVIYTHTPEGPEMMVYTPPVDVQYVSPTPYFYSPTIPTTWYPLGINSQGFIFPTPVNQNLQNN
ncbi:putative bifunctional UDP-N-acetylglucosamine transferase and deubiquitinase ALG13 isoform X2 [Tribolium castaneum]|uniref:Bifunctional UDP-N-acetylglucosamine transferase and deubiquitinase ALG13-like Protein n=1 Tax=Tribolium castaneum TaxID=7070 RepID=A0A139WMQ8_TRICA|nr:PREDICTED: putative bifunctional UDP-N-acetylglucosamine transferase and deubiquitinase ALG13 isoform X2 [Tribolium castaneum]KYB29260.1 Putative bifunctional UDP-N-acetylglucosamine transferase and deubiquitinase ALG13-like Protein [Tribolium castaneum]|eukprot:XP_008201209.1 PREDICTED: putative bifunctional UDP-N-acetylglucosamine transferase and deubiquitinase ALG13 isoform X2 [Tribolium castaneum]